jgi:hypothetical protein
VKISLKRKKNNKHEKRHKIRLDHLCPQSIKIQQTMIYREPRLVQKRFLPRNQAEIFTIADSCAKYFLYNIAFGSVSYYVYSRSKAFNDRAITISTGCLTSNRIGWHKPQCLWSFSNELWEVGSNEYLLVARKAIYGEVSSSMGEGEGVQRPQLL